LFRSLLFAVKKLLYSYFDSKKAQSLGPVVIISECDLVLASHAV